MLNPTQFKADKILCTQRQLITSGTNSNCETMKAESWSQTGQDLCEAPTTPDWTTYAKIQCLSLQPLGVFDNDYDEVSNTCTNSL